MVDSQLVDRAQSALATSPHLSRRHFKLEARAGKLIVRGTVDSYYQKQMAQEALRKVDGVETIENHLQVHWK
ncbi:MAG: BON domain-containing protein [Planctomycetia bacterium]|nr:BON domain-containing protein [Planctomycetia bacterium]